MTCKSYFGIVADRKAHAQDIGRGVKRYEYDTTVGEFIEDMASGYGWHYGFRPREMAQYLRRGLKNIGPSTKIHVVDTSYPASYESSASYVWNIHGPIRMDAPDMQEDESGYVHTPLWPTVAVQNTEYGMYMRASL